MKIVVLLKETPDTEAKIEAAGDSIQTAGIKYIINPYDEFAVEEALKIKDAQPTAEVVVLSFGPPAMKERMLRALAMGADRGLLVNNEGLEKLDSLSTAKILVAALKGENADLVFCGKQGIDDDNMHVGVMVAELMGWPHVNVVTKAEYQAGKAKVEREVEGGQVEVYELSLPAVLGTHKSLNTPRYASLPGIMKAKKKPLDQRTVEDMGMSRSNLNADVKTSISRFSAPPPKPKGKVLKGEAPAVMVEKLVQLLRDEAKVI